MGCDAVAPETLIPERRRRTKLGLAGRWLGTLALGGALLVAGAMLAAALLGYERYVITGDSMTGTYDRGSLLFSRTAPVEVLEVGDVITYEPPAKSGVKGLVTHRIVSIADGEGGVPVFRTKGDANETRDPWRFTLEQTEVARASLGVPFVGYAFAALGIRELRMLLIGLPALLIAVGLGARLWRQAGDEARELTEVARARLDEAAEPKGG